MIKLWSESTSGSGTIWKGPYLLHKTIFAQNGLRNFRLEVHKILVLLCRYLLYAVILKILKFQSQFSHERCV